MRELIKRPRERRGAAFAVTALLTGAACIGTSALWVKVSEPGPVSTAFWRVFLALPLLWVWALAERDRPPRAVLAADRRLMIWAGLFFAGDLAVWHWSIVLTSVANATLLANVAPIFVTLAAWLLFRKMPSGRFLVGLATAPAISIQPSVSPSKIHANNAAITGWNNSPTEEKVAGRCAIA